MDSRSTIELHSPSESVTNHRTIRLIFELCPTGRTPDGISGVPVLVYASSRPNVGNAVSGGWREPEQRWKPGSATGLLRTIPTMLGHCFGAFHAPVGNSLFCFYGFQKTFVQRTQKDFPNLPQMQSFGTREHGPLAWLRPV